MKWIFLGVGIILLLSYSKKSITSAVDASGLLPNALTPENSTLPSLGGLDPGFSNPCACKSGGSGSVKSATGSAFTEGGGTTSSPSNPFSINSIGQVVSSATGLPPNIFTGAI